MVQIIGGVVSFAQVGEKPHLLDNKLLRVKKEKSIPVIEYLILDSSLIRAGIWAMAPAPS